MKLTYKNERGMVLTAENPDESLNPWVRSKIRETIETELRNFAEECSVAMRKLEAGQTVVLESRPISVELSRPADVLVEAK